MILGRNSVKALALLLGLGTVQPALAASDAELREMDGYALLLGRGIGCGLDTDRAVGAIGAWFDRTFPPGSASHERYLPVLTNAVQLYAEQQRQGYSPDSCADIARAFATMRW